MSEKVTYHPEAGRALIFDVLNKNADGTVDIGTSDGLVVVAKCAITSDVIIGSATSASPSRQTGTADTSLESKKVEELREIADKLGVDHDGLKKQELIDAITTAQTGDTTEI